MTARPGPRAAGCPRQRPPPRASPWPGAGWPLWRSPQPPTQRQRRADGPAHATGRTCARPLKTVLTARHWLGRWARCAAHSTTGPHHQPEAPATSHRPHNERQSRLPPCAQGRRCAPLGWPRPTAPQPGRLRLRGGPGFGLVLLRGAVCALGPGAARQSQGGPFAGLGGAIESRFV